ncbi:uncharacterized protein LOC134753288 [Cydia strobilella]|uniref:uncharacterized protein LOC134753288 n=1 Tax=Cydia strobilella TaxID=1100964 RepID=UPI003007DA22
MSRMEDMVDTPGSILPQMPTPEPARQCCICMRKDQKLLHLCLINGGGNSLFSLLCDDQDDSPDDNKEPTRLIICWECDAIMSNVVCFRQQACKAQKRLSSIAEGRSMSQNTFVLIPPSSRAPGSGPEAILEYRTQTQDLTQPVFRIVRYVLPDGSAASLPPSQ